MTAAAYFDYFRDYPEMKGETNASLIQMRNVFIQHGIAVEFIRLYERAILVRRNRKECIELPAYSGNPLTAPNNKEGIQSLKGVTKQADYPLYEKISGILTNANGMVNTGTAPLMTLRYVMKELAALVEQSSMERA